MNYTARNQDKQRAIEEVIRLERWLGRQTYGVDDLWKLPAWKLQSIIEGLSKLVNSLDSKENSDEIHNKRDRV